eukprot:CCRYP_000087-RD/>CCRYP_000087-RD protein AED:0.03 eAED:0.03 QI:330/1/1/1/0.87/0.77/9/489/1372
MRGFCSDKPPATNTLDPIERAVVWRSLVADLESDCNVTTVDDRAISSDSPVFNTSGSHSSDMHAAFDSIVSEGDSSSDHLGTELDCPGLQVVKLEDMSWPASLSDWVTCRGGEPSKKFFLAAVKIAHSLAIKLDSRCEMNSERGITEGDIVFSNVVVNAELTGDSDFRTKSWTDEESGKSRDLNVRAAILCLGRVFFELFTRGAALPPKPIENTDTESSFLSISDGKKTSTVSVDDPIESYESAIHERLHASYSKSPFAMKISNCPGGERGILSLPNKHRRAFDQDEEKSALTLMQTAGVPSSVCRLINDMLMNDELGDFGSLFRHDVVADLKQMCDNPALFLYDTLTMRFKPVMCDNMYGRGKELQVADYIAGKVLSPKAEGTKQEVLMISGHSGCGKSTLVNELVTSLEKNGWGIIQCKFDTLSSGTSPVILAFDQFFSDINTMPDVVNNLEIQGIRNRIIETFDEANLEFLCSVVPSLRCFASKKGSIDSGLHSSLFNSSEVQNSKYRLNLLINLMAKVISSEHRPLLLFLDDLHWADAAAVDLVNAILEDVGEEAGFGSSAGHMLLIGAFRNNEVACEHPLFKCLQQIKQDDHVSLSEIQLSGLRCEDVELMVSDALSYPRRLTRSLSKLIHQKSMGNPLFVREFLNDLCAENLLTYSLSSRKWEWDEDTIQEKNVSNSVAELLTRQLLRLPDAVLRGLRVMSCFGAKVHQQVLSYVKDACGNSDIIIELDCALREGLIEHSKDIFKFRHDMIYEAVVRGIDRDDQINMLGELIKTLLTRTFGEEIDNILFVIVDLINRLGTAMTPNSIDHLQCARLNLSAGEKSIQTSDFASALGYIESGISFLGSGSWDSNYSLTLSLFEKYAVVNWAQGNIDAMKASIETVSKHARCFDDKLKSIHLLVHSLGLDGKSAKATSHCFAVLEYLGESFPQNIDDPSCIAQQLLDLKLRLKAFIPASGTTFRVNDFPVMQDRKKLEAMSFLYESACSSYQQKSPLFNIVSARMVKLSLDHGLCVQSSLGFALTALAFVLVLKDISEGYRLGKFALSLVSSNSAFRVLLPEVYCIVYGIVSVWKEPMQVLLSPLLDAYKVCIKSGNFSAAGASSVLYTYRAFFSGYNLPALHKDVVGFSRLMYSRKRTFMTLSLQPILQAVMSLRGIPSQSGKEWSEGGGYDAVLDHLAVFVTKNEMALCESFFAVIMANSFIFHKGEDAKKVVEQYLDFFERHDATYPAHYVSIYRCFYGGLIAFHYYRKTQDSYWLDRATYTIRRLEAWNTECQWNFQNKLLLLQAEHSFSIGGTVSRTQQLYNMAISLSNKHRFIHEEAIACELFNAFREMNRSVDSNGSLDRAYQCYESWGANAKLTSLLLPGGV